MRSLRFMGVLAVGACVMLAAPASAQNKGTGKLSISIIATPGADPAPATLGAKAAGSIAAKASATVAGKPPTGGAITTLKLAKDISDPLKPGFGPGTYLLEIESGASSEADAASAAGSTVFAQVVIDAVTGKCTIKPHPAIDNDTPGECNLVPSTTPPICAPAAVGKCSATAYQLAGPTNYLLGPGTGQPVAGRFRLRKGVNVAGCNTGDIMLGGAPLFGATTCHDPANQVVGVMGVANGEID
jgi:hypothetical protein